MRTGLRTEVVISIIFLLGAALLFSGFLLVKLTERELLAQKRAGLRQTMVLLSAAFTAPDAAGPANQLTGLRSVLTSLGLQENVLGWRVLGSDGEILAETTTVGEIEFGPVPIAALDFQNLVENLRYSSSWSPLRRASRSYLDLAVPLGEGEGPAGLLQVRFSLAGLEERVHRAQQLVLAYVLLYGLVLTLFGVYVLNRNIVRPVRRLQQASAGIAEGDLEAVEVPAGPAEIRDLATSFNQMVQALGASRGETEAQIASLEEANRALRQAREDLLRSEKMASVGHLSAGMAHEIGNPLGAIVGYLNLLDQDLDDPGSAELIKRSLQEADRIDQLIRELLEYAAPDPVEPEEFDPAAAVREGVELVHNQGALTGIRVRDELPAIMRPVRMSRARFLQVCINLLLNARDAMPAGGTLVLSRRNAPGMIGLCFADSGIGMRAETLRDIFEPFFTTKEPGKGTGLGLPVCQRIIEQAEGRIEVASQAGSGSCFTVWLPVVDASVFPAESGSTDQANRTPAKDVHYES